MNIESRREEISLVRTIEVKSESHTDDIVV